MLKQQLFIEHLYGLIAIEWTYGRISRKVNRQAWILEGMAYTFLSSCALVRINPSCLSRCDLSQKSI